MTPATLAADRYPGLCPQDASPQAMIAYALAWGIDQMDGAQLRRLDAIALAAVRALPQELTETDRKLDDTMHDLRLRIAAEQTSRAQRWARIAADLAGMDTSPDQDQDVIDQDQAPELTDQERACKLLAAALTLIMGPQGGNGGGRGARLQPPPPTRPPQGTALRVPTTPAPSRPGDAIDF